MSTSFNESNSLATAGTVTELEDSDSLPSSPIFEDTSLPASSCSPPSTPKIDPGVQSLPSSPISRDSSPPPSPISRSPTPLNSSDVDSRPLSPPSPHCQPPTSGDDTGVTSSHSGYYVNICNGEVPCLPKEPPLVPESHNGCFYLVWRGTRLGVFTDW